MITTDFVDRDRFDRMRRIEWVVVDSIRGKRCLVVGAGVKKSTSTRASPTCAKSLEPIVASVWP